MLIATIASLAAAHAPEELLLARALLKFATHHEDAALLDLLSAVKGVMPSTAPKIDALLAKLAAAGIVPVQPSAPASP
jgi:hypothetical protein